LGREATLFDTEFNYTHIIKAIRTGDNLAGTIEVDPNYGKYHYDGHRKCNISFHPKESLKNNGICPVCKKPLIIGVQYRVEELADRPEGYVKKDAKPFESLMPLSELLASLLNTTPATKKVGEFHKSLLRNTSEYHVLRKMDKKELIKRTDENIAKVILKNRAGKIKIKPGYDGVYGVPLLE
jgi:PHP family Zn ribbon phosphoesterase